MSEKRFIIHGDVVSDTDMKIPITLWSNKKQQKKFCDELNILHEEKEYWKKRALLLENKYNEGDSIEWLRNNTVWEQIPTNHKSFTKTKFER